MSELASGTPLSDLIKKPTGTISHMSEIMGEIPLVDQLELTVEPANQVYFTH